MNKETTKETVYTSLRQFEDAFLPESFRTQEEVPPDPQVLAANLAEETIDRVRQRIAE